jgi:hypothetical protein
MNNAELEDRLYRSCKRHLYELDGTSDLATVQALLLITLRDLGAGKTAQAWQSCGLAYM